MPKQENLVGLQNRRVLVTGASSGIGEATARRFAEAGAEVILLSDHLDSLNRVRDAILARYGAAPPVATVYCDLSRPDQVAGLLDRLEAERGPIDTLVNNAGVGLGATVLETRPQDLRFVFEVNFFALHALCQQAFRNMATRRFGYILNVSSAAGRFGSPTIAAYSASKGAVHAYTQALRIEAEAYDVHVSEIVPISVRTPFFDNVRGKTYAPGGIMQTPERVAASIVWASGRRRPPAEVFPFRPVQLVFALDALLPGLLGCLAGRAHVRSVRSLPSLSIPQDEGSEQRGNDQGSGDLI